MFKTEIIYRTKVDATKDMTFKNKIQAWQKNLTERLSQTPGKVKRPIRWTSERQRRAFFATDGFGRGIPTRRTNAVARWNVFVDYDGIDDIKSFTERLIAILSIIDPRKKPQSLKADPDGLLVSITNPVPYQRFVTGIDQQGFHADTGWIQTAPIITDGINELDSIVSGGI